MSMEDTMTKSQSEIRALVDNRSEATRNKDLDQLMSCYSPDIVYFDVVPPLQYIGSAALRDRFRDWFDLFDSPISQEIRNLSVVASGDIAVAHILVRTSGTLKNGREIGHWVRATDSCQRLNDRWLITHEHISLPVDMRSGSAIMDLLP